VIKTFDSTNGEFTIYTDSFVNYDLTTKNLVITCTSSTSTAAAGAETDSIALLIKDECWDADLTAPTFDQTSWTWELWA